VYNTGESSVNNKNMVKTKIILAIILISFLLTGAFLVLTNEAPKQEIKVEIIKHPSESIKCIDYTPDSNLAGYCE